MFPQKIQPFLLGVVIYSNHNRANELDCICQALQNTHDLRKTFKVTHLYPNLKKEKPILKLEFSQIHAHAYNLFINRSTNLLTY